MYARLTEFGFQPASLLWRQVKMYESKTEAKQMKVNFKVCLSDWDCWQMVVSAFMWQESRESSLQTRKLERKVEIPGMAQITLLPMPLTLTVW